MKRILILSVLIFGGLGESYGFQKKKKFDQLVTISTSFGEMKLVLFDDTPLHKENFLKLVHGGFYDSLLFHRVINEFMIQGGDPDSRNAEPGQRLGKGGPGYRVPAEILPNHIHKKGALAAARTGNRGNPEKESSGSQFYIVQGKTLAREQLEKPNQERIINAFRDLMKNKPGCELAKEYQAVIDDNPGDGLVIKAKVESTLDRLTEETGVVFGLKENQINDYSTIGGTPFLDREYTVFGQVISGISVIDSIAVVKTDRSDRPEEDVHMSIAVKRMRRKKISKLYDYEYNQE